MPNDQREAVGRATPMRCEKSGVPSKILEGLFLALPGPKSLVRFSGEMPTFIERSEGEGLTLKRPSVVGLGKGKSGIDRPAPPPPTSA